MITDPIPASDVRYNSASACFEAKVTVHGAGPARVYACEFAGDLSLQDDEIVTALRREALRRHLGRNGLSSTRRSSEPRPRYGVERPETHTRHWLARLPALAGLRAA